MRFATWPILCLLLLILTCKTASGTTPSHPIVRAICSVFLHAETNSQLVNILSLKVAISLQQYIIPVSPLGIEIHLAQHLVNRLS